MQPTGEQISRFLDCFELLGKFDAAMTLTRGMTAFPAKDWPDKPDPDVMAVKAWLTELKDK
jgi:hypothetical protein